MRNLKNVNSALIIFKIEYFFEYPKSKLDLNFKF